MVKQRSAECVGGQPGEHVNFVDQASRHVRPARCFDGVGAASPELRGGVPQVDHEAVGRLSSSGLHARGPRPLATAQEHALSAIPEFSSSGGTCSPRERKELGMAGSRPGERGALCGRARQQQ